MERPYVDQDLAGLTIKQLLKLVDRQRGKWQGSLSRTKVKKETLTSALLDPTYGFTTNNPQPAAMVAAQAVPQTVPVSPAAAPPPQSVASTQEVQLDVEISDVRIYIEDCRSTPAARTVAIISLRVFDRKDFTVAVFRVLSKEVVSKIQQSNSAIEIPLGGMARFSVPDPEDSEWRLPFVRMEHGQSLDDMDFNPESLEIQQNPSGPRLKLFIDSMNSISSASSNMKTDNNSTDALASTSSSATPQEAATDTEQQINQPGVRYLIEKLAVRAGYDSFSGQRGRVLSNPDAVQGWRFAVDFTRDYNKVRTPQPNSVKITKGMIQKALGIGSTWLSNAHTAIRLIEIYGRDKQHATPEVIEVLERVDDPPLGSATLYLFLVKWNKDHPIIV